jgi:Family of unknown function (DUF5719)
MKFLLRLVSALAVLAAAGALFLLPSVPMLPEAKLEARTVGVEPLPLRANCAGPLVEVGGVQGTALGEISRIGNPLVAVHGSELDSEQSWASFEVPGSPQSTDLLSANQVQSVDRPRVRGLAAANCAQPNNFGYFVSGNSGPGSESILILGNPNQVEVLVELELALESEIITERITVAAGEQKVVSLVALSGAEPIFALSYQTSGLPVSAFMQQRTVNGLAATGVDLVTPQLPKSSGVIPGIEVVTEGFAPAELRVFNPGLVQTEVVLQLKNSERTEEIRILVPAGKILSQGVSLAAGATLILFESSQPVVLALKNQILDEGLDFSWLSPTDGFSEPLRLVVSRTSTLFIANPSVGNLSLVIEGPVGQSAVVSGGGQVGIPVTPGSYLLSGNLEFHALLSIKNSTGYATIAPSQMRNSGEELKVLVP